jgi:hypothetical protein
LVKRDTPPSDSERLVYPDEKNVVNVGKKYESFFPHLGSKTKTTFLDERKTDFLSEQLLAYWIEINDDLTDSLIFV